MTRTAGEVGAFRMRSRQRAIGDAVAVVIEVAIEGLHLLEVLGRQHFAAIGTIAVVPRQLRHHPIVHPDVEIAQHEHGRLEAIGQIEGFDRKLESLAWIGGIQADMPRVAV